MRPLFSDSRRAWSKGWSKIFTGGSAPSQPPAEDKRPLHRNPIRNVNSISDALRSAGDKSKRTDGAYAHDTASWKTASSEHGKKSENPITFNSGFALDDLELGGVGGTLTRNDTNEERKISDHI